MNVNVSVPEELIQANELQKIGDYELSRKVYQNFFVANPEHIMRFKALFEVTDTFFMQEDMLRHSRDIKSFWSIAVVRKNLQLMRLDGSKPILNYQTVEFSLL